MEVDRIDQIERVNLAWNEYQLKKEKLRREAQLRVEAAQLKRFREARLKRQNAESELHP